MKKQSLTFTLSHAKEKNGTPLQPIAATVPGAVQLDYAKALDYAPYYYGLNFKQFDWMEDEYFFYDTELDFTLAEGELARLCFMGLDYRYEITAGKMLLAAGEGAFTPVTVDVSAFAGKKTPLRVTLFPIPKRQPQPQNRAQASACCKPPSSYGWDWHPRLVPTGIWKEAYLEILPAGAPFGLEASYVLTEGLDAVTVHATCCVNGEGALTAKLIAPDGTVAVEEQLETEEHADFTLRMADPQLWFPRGYGDQPLYTLEIAGAGEKLRRRIGFRRSRLVENAGASSLYAKGFPKGPNPAPATIEINGVRVFAKGSNWVNTEIFPSLATPERYDELLQMAYDANMNILRMWGGQYINHDYFYDKCDELGIMIWQEFMLSCNLYPDTDEYLTVLKQEATSIVKQLRTHPSLTFWCGGNELFNAWSGLTLQSHPLRLLDAVCYEHDRNTPFNMTSPLHGMAHGSYVKVVFPDAERKAGDYSHGEEFLAHVKRSKNTAYTEFGCNGAASKDYILKYVMDEKDYADCNAENPVWKSHHAFRAWNESCWLGIPEVHHFFGGYKDTDDLIEKSIYLQDLCYKSMFEEMRRQAPLCAMAINWDFNEPWPAAAGNSLVSWPNAKKSCLDEVGAALRPTLLSLEVPRNRYVTGEAMEGTVWLLNDCAEAAPAVTAEIYLLCGDEKRKLTELRTEEVAPRKNGKFAGFTLKITDEIPERFAISLECKENPALNSLYRFVRNTTLSNIKKTHTILGDNDDFSDFLK